MSEPGPGVPHDGAPWGPPPAPPSDSPSDASPSATAAPSSAAAASSPDVPASATASSSSSSGDGGVAPARPPSLPPPPVRPLPAGPGPVWLPPVLVAALVAEAPAYPRLPPPRPGGRTAGEGIMVVAVAASPGPPPGPPPASPWGRPCTPGGSLGMPPAPGWPLPPAPPAGTRAGAAPAWPGAGGPAGPGAAGTAWRARLPWPDEARPTPWRRRFLVTAAIAGIAAFAAVVRGAGPWRGALGYPAIIGRTTDGTFPVGLLQAAILVALTVLVALGLGVTWLRGVGRRLGRPGIRAALGPVAADPTTGDPALPAARRAWVVAAVLPLAGAAAAGIGAALAVAAPEAAPAGGLLVAAGGAITLAGLGLVPTLARAVERRIALAQQAETQRPVRLPAARRPLVGLAASALVVAVAGAPVSGAIRPPELVAGAAGDCTADAGWTCTMLTVPADRLDDGSPAGTRATIDIAFARHAAPHPPADGRRVLVYATGGPGSPGLDAAPMLETYLDERIVDTTDLVVYDPRGTGESSPVGCPVAAREWAFSDRGEDAARAFTRGCPVEAGVATDELPRYASSQVAEDIDAIRTALGVEKIVLYGSSYGTVVGQAYAAAHPDRVQLLVLDAPVDRTLRPHDLWIQAADGYLDAMRRTFDACRADEACSASLEDPEGAYADLRATLTRDGAIHASVRTQNGSREDRSMTLALLDDITANAMYSTFDRMLWLRALAAWAHNDPRPLVMLPVRWGGYSGNDFAYFATWCADTPDDPAARAGGPAAYRAAARSAGITDDAARGIADAVLPCLYWPSHAASSDAPADAVGVPTLVLTSTQDPVTRTEAARAIAGRLANAWLVETRGGDHGSMQVPCAQRMVAALVVDGQAPGSRTSSCVDAAVDEFVPLAPSPASTAEDAVLGVLYELTTDPWFVGWDGEAKLTVPCGESGFIVLTPVGTSTRANLVLQGCAYIAGTAFDGTGWIDGVTYDVTLDVKARRGPLHLVWVGSEWSLTGTWDGREIDE